MIDLIQKFVRSVAPDSRGGQMLRKIRRSHLAAWAIRKDLRALARFYGSDKWGTHRYAAHYQHHFGPRRREKLTILEIGVGGYNVPEAGGGSLRMWKRFFPKARIFAIDLFDKSPHNEGRIQVFQGSQDDPAFIESVVASIGPIDIVIDDGSHINAHVLASFNLLFPHVRESGWYVIEDLQTSYWPAFGGSENPLADDTGIALCKRLVDGLNWEEFQDRQPGRFDADITAVHMYHNLAFIQKGRNVEGSNRAMLKLDGDAGKGKRTGDQGGTIGEPRL